MTMQVELRANAAPPWAALVFALAGAALFNLSSVWALLFLGNVDVGLATIDAADARNACHGGHDRPVAARRFRGASQRDGAAAHARCRGAMDRSADGTTVVHPVLGRRADGDHGAVATDPRHAVARDRRAGTLRLVGCSTASAGSSSSRRSMRSTSGAFSGFARRSRRCAGPRAHRRRSCCRGSTAWCATRCISA